MAVQQNKKSRRSAACTALTNFLTNPPLAVEPTTGEGICVITSARAGYYRGKKVVKTGASRAPPGASDRQSRDRPSH